MDFSTQRRPTPPPLPRTTHLGATAYVDEEGPWKVETDVVPEAPLEAASVDKEEERCG
jgi:hypothetical protein